MKAKRAIVTFVTTCVGVVLLALNCGPYSFYSRETVRIDLAASTITHSFHDVRPSYADSVEKGWQELTDLLDEATHMDTLPNGRLRKAWTSMELDSKKRLSVTLNYKLLPDTGANADNVPSWEDITPGLIKLLAENGEVVLFAEPTFYECDDDSCTFETKHRAIPTEKNRLIVFPATQTVMEYSFVYSLPRHEVTYQKMYNEEREERGWEQEW